MDDRRRPGTTDSRSGWAWGARRMAARHTRHGALVVACLVVSYGCGGVVSARGAQVREPAVAGQFYPVEARAVRLALDGLFADALPAPPERPVAIVAPHAGWIYSGQIAADGFAQAAGHDYDVIVLLGTNHTGAAFGRASVFDGDGFRTPLGVAAVDLALARSLPARDARFVLDQAAHAREHSIEVQVPLVQRLFPRARILPIVVGVSDAAVCARLGRALADVLDGRRALVVASSDLSHYPSAADATAVDRRTLEAIASLNADRFQSAVRQAVASRTVGLDTAACGEAPILVAMAAATALGAARGRIVSYANSADVPVGDRERVVGYGAVAFTNGPAPPDTRALDPAAGATPSGPAAAAAALDAADRAALLRLARETLRRYLRSGTLPLPRGFRSGLPTGRGTFVTLKRNGTLRGCIGRIQADVPLPLLVSAMALEAALQDPRFPPVSAAELDSLEIELSILTAPKRVGGPADIVIGRDGVVMRKGQASAVFLPQIATEEGWDLEQMLGHLSVKAGLPADGWMQGAGFWTFQADTVREGRTR